MGELTVAICGEESALASVLASCSIQELLGPGRWKAQSKSEPGSKSSLRLKAWKLTVVLPAQVCIARLKKLETDVQKQ